MPRKREESDVIVNRHFLWYLSILLIISITLGSLGCLNVKNGPLLSSKGHFEVFGLFRLTFHRIVHFVAFGSLAILLSLIGRRIQHRLVALAAVIGFGLLIEILEFRLSTNKFEVWDVKDDALAACVGYALVEVYMFVASASWRRSVPIEDPVTSHRSG
jgi:hypothetical protein